MQRANRMIPGWSDYRKSLTYAQKLRTKGDYEQSDAVLAGAGQKLESELPAPQLTPKKREPDTYCAACGAPVPGGLFILNAHRSRRTWSWVIAESHECDATRPQQLPLF